MTGSPSFDFFVFSSSICISIFKGRRISAACPAERIRGNPFKSVDIRVLSANARHRIRIVNYNNPQRTPAPKPKSPFSPSEPPAPRD